MEIGINNLTSFKVKHSLLKKTVRKILKEERKNDCNVSIALVGEKKIKEINKKYRKKEKVTDVLSFSYCQLDDFYKDRILGEIIICPSQVKKEKKELIRVLIHGVLHLLGYDHEKSKKEAEIMEKKEKEYIA